MPKINWVAARKMYVTEPDVSYSDVAKKFGVALATVKQHGLKEKWADARRELINKANEQSVEKAAESMSAVNQRHTLTYRNMQALATDQISIAINELRKARSEDKDISHKDPKIISPFALEKLFSSLKIAIEGERVALGLPITVTKNETDLKIQGGIANLTIEQIEVIHKIADTAVKDIKKTNSA